MIDFLERELRFKKGHSFTVCVRDFIQIKKGEFTRFPKDSEPSLDFLAGEIYLSLPISCGFEEVDKLQIEADAERLNSLLLSGKIELAKKAISDSKCIEFVPDDAVSPLLELVEMGECVEVGKIPHFFFDKSHSFNILLLLNKKWYP